MPPYPMLRPTTLAEMASLGLSPLLSTPYHFFVLDRRETQSSWNLVCIWEERHDPTLYHVRLLHVTALPPSLEAPRFARHASNEEHDLFDRLENVVGAFEGTHEEFELLLSFLRDWMHLSAVEGKPEPEGFIRRWPQQIAGDRTDSASREAPGRCEDEHEIASLSWELGALDLQEQAGQTDTETDVWYDLYFGEPAYEYQPEAGIRALYPVYTQLILPSWPQASLATSLGASGLTVPQQPPVRRLAIMSIPQAHLATQDFDPYLGHYLGHLVLTPAAGRNLVSLLVWLQTDQHQ